MNLRGWRPWAAALALTGVAAGDSLGQGGISFGVESRSVFGQDMVLTSDPVLTRLQSNNLTSVATIRTMSYMREVAFNGLSTTTFRRKWSKIDNNSQYTYLRMGYSSAFMEGMVKVGAAGKLIALKETGESDVDNPGAAADIANQTIDFSYRAQWSQGFAYGFEIRGQPYESDNFSVLAGLHFDHIINNGDIQKQVSINVSTRSLELGRTTVERSNEFSHLRYGLTVSAALKFEQILPFLGLEYADARMRIQRKDVTVTQTFDAAGAVTASETITDELAYTLKPKTLVGLVVGFTIPFERGGITLEGRMRGEDSLKFSGYIAF